MFTIQNMVFFIIAGILLIVWLIYYFVGKKYESLFANLDEKEYPLKDIYFLGYAVMESIHYKYRSKNDRKLRQSAEILYEKKYAEYYVRLSYAQKITFAFTLVLIGFIMYGFTSETAILFVFLIFAFCAYYYFGTLMQEKIKKRQDEMLSDFSEIISQLALLTNAGMILREAWERIAYNGQTTLYLEMQRTVEEMKNGVAEVEALQRFGSRCILSEVKKATATMAQGIVKGNRELAEMLQKQSAEAWQMKKHLAVRAGEKAASKLLIPMMLMFVGIIIMILIPIFANIGV